MRMRGLGTAAALAAALNCVAPVAAQQTPALWLPLPAPTERGNAIIYDPQYLAKAESDRRRDCATEALCRLQLLGVLEHNGAVVLRATALTW
jgi:hypothetical protein